MKEQLPRTRRVTHKAKGYEDNAPESDWAASEAEGKETAEAREPVEEDWVAVDDLNAVLEDPFVMVYDEAKSTKTEGSSRSI